MRTQLQPINRVGNPYAEEKTEKSVVIPFRVPASWKPVLKQEAERLGMGLSEYIRAAIREKHDRDNNREEM